MSGRLGRRSSLIHLSFGINDLERVRPERYLRAALRQCIERRGTIFNLQRALESGGARAM